MKQLSSVFLSNSTELSSSLYLADEPLGGVLFIAGGGLYTKEFYREWQEHLALSGYHSLAFDFPGIGSSPGEMTSTSLRSRFLDSTNAFAWFIAQTGLPPDQIFPCGRSMGGPLALRLAIENKIQKAILLYPAAYAEAAYDKSFGPAFSEVIRQDKSWHNSPDFALAEQFAGELLVIYGEQDKIIPKEIQKRYLQIAKTKGTGLVLPGAGHNAYLWEEDSTSLLNRQKLFRVTTDFLSSNQKPVDHQICCEMGDHRCP